MSEVVVVKCDCDNKYQEKRLGDNIRFANKTNNGGRCTSCGTNKSHTFNRG